MVSPARPRARRWSWLQAVGWGAAGRKVSRPLAQVSAARSPYLSLSCRAGPSQISEGCLSFTRGFPRPSPEEFAIPNNGSYRWWWHPSGKWVFKSTAHAHEEHSSHLATACSNSVHTSSLIEESFFALPITWDKDSITIHYFKLEIKKIISSIKIFYKIYLFRYYSVKQLFVSSEEYSVFSYCP